MSWTDERIDSLKRLWGDGLSASQIASQLGGVSRNAVIGKVHRLKLESRIKPPVETLKREALLEGAAMQAVAAAEVAPPAPPPLPRLVVSTPAPAAPAPLPRFVAPAIEMPEPDGSALGAVAEVQASAGVVEAAPATRNLTLIQLSERTCKWPLGDPLSDEFRFCGNHSRDASPYCAYHARLAFQPASERRRVR
ncbi:GcrA family cell cycle regulator [Aureimonas jatrophae]|uniref:Global cell cycle regulator GcrA n=1 Tax=Aureimonas jatrophae TaxID=1166073 RepID=A0A1H0L6D5_9HYPH|nr:GcrA family cell cycle regulator [Aureimonas jatrophae]MBB3952424.1 GcrA cell cycle regulator [Aureimonas jatrophae]SDO63642.1 Global cell cycle regulator GcrA [Aureimonas jatrophae]